MKKLLFLLLLLPGMALSAQKSEEKLVRKSFDAYKKAILNDRGEEAVKYVDSRTVKYYDDMAGLVKNADSASVAGLALMDRLMVFSIRHRAPQEEIPGFDGRKLLVFAIQNGMVGKNSVAENSIGDVTIQGDFAKGQFLRMKEPTPLSFHFYKEEQVWKLDLTALFPISAFAFQKMVKDSGQEENDYLFFLLEMLTGRKPGPEIWQPAIH